MAEPVLFCDNLIATQECDHDCVAHLHDGKILPCPYAILEEAKHCCIDFEPRKKYTA